MCVCVNIYICEYIYEYIYVHIIIYIYIYIYIYIIYLQKIQINHKIKECVHLFQTFKYFVDIDNVYRYVFAYSKET